MKIRFAKGLRTFGLLASATALAVAAAACGGSSSGSTSSSSTTASGPIRIGIVSSLTGDAASTFNDTFAGAQARIDQQNAEGGVDGRKLELFTADDQSSTTGLVTALHILVQRDHVLAVIGFSEFMFAGYKYLQQQGIPVLGAAFDGPEWGEQPNTNMFSIDPTQGQVTLSAVWGNFMKKVGITNFGVVAYAGSPASSQGAQGIAQSAKMAGVKVGFADYSLPQEGGNFTALVLQMKQAGVNGYLCDCVLSTEISLATAAQQAGLKAVGIQSVGYDNALLADKTVVSAMNGNYFYSFYVPFESQTPGVVDMLSNLKKYDPKYPGGIPDYGTAGGYLSADLAIKGLEVAGKNPTGQSIISGLHGVTNYDAGGVLTSPVSFSLSNFGKPPSPTCSYFVQLKNDNFVPLPKVCGSQQVIH